MATDNDFVVDDEGFGGEDEEFDDYTGYDDEEDVMQVWDEETHSFTIIRIIKSFTARLIQSKDEVKDYYDIIKIRK